jgi:hypothetical protein
MRPQGYLGRGFPIHHPELGLTGRILDWSDDHQLIALSKRGEDCVGNLLVGEESLDRFIGGTSPSYNRADYPALATGALAGQPGSSVGGEHPKFVVYSGNRHVLVKFAGGDGSAADRWRDLLLCEHLALEMLQGLEPTLVSSTCQALLKNRPAPPVSLSNSRMSGAEPAGEPMANGLAAGARHSSRRSMAGQTAGACRTLLPDWMRTRTNSRSRDENIKSLHAERDGTKVSVTITWKKWLVKENILFFIG